MNTYKPLVRLYYYTDSDRGFGDGGTFKYVRMSEDCFVGIEKLSFTGNKYTSWSLSKIGTQVISKVKGFNYYDIGWIFVEEEVHLHEIEKIRNKLKLIEEVLTIK